MKMLKVMSKLLIQTMLGLLLWLLPDPELLQAKKPGKWYQFVHQKKDRMQARWNGKHLEIQLKPRKGEGGYSLANRVLNKKHRSLKTVIRYSGRKKLLLDRPLRFPVKVVEGSIRGSALQALFPKDRATEEGWLHRVSFNWETTTLLAGVFAKEGITASHLTKRNQLRRNGNLLKINDPILIPWDWMSRELRISQPFLKKPLALKYDASGKAFAEYRLKKDETIYSSVVIRFTGRILHDEVDQMAKELMKLNRISNARRISKNQRIRIPLKWLAEEYYAGSVLETASSPNTKKVVAKPKKPNPFHKIHVILDAGHGGRDTGAMAGSKKKGDRIYEDEVVYDISQRMEGLFKKKGMVVHKTVIDPNQRKPAKKLRMRFDQDEYLNVTPRYTLRNAHTGVNMRVFLINHLYHKLLKQKIPKENIIFMSIHGDALHSSLRGAMVYYPDSRFRKTRFRIKGRVYQKRREYDSRLQFAKKENRRSAELSRSLGGSVISSFRKYGLPTHRGRTVRGYFYRRGKKSLPAVLRYSKVPTSILVEVANLKNLKDRRSLLKSRTRQKMAEALVHSIGQHYQQNEALIARR